MMEKAVMAMSEQTIFEKMGIKYEERDGIFYPIFGVCENAAITELGKYGRMWMTWLFDLDRLLHRKYLLEGTLVEKALEFQEYACELEAEIVSSMDTFSNQTEDFLMSVAMQRQKWEVAQEIIIRDGREAIIKNKELREGRIREKDEKETNNYERT